MTAPLLAAALALAQAPATTPEEERSIEGWTCTVSERIDGNVSATLQVIVDPDGTRREMSYHVRWSARPGDMSEPGPDAAQAMFTRLRARLDREVADAAAKCQANPGPTHQEMEDSLINWIRPIPGPDLTPMTPPLPLPRR